VKKLDKCMPHELTENKNKKNHCFEVLSSLILRNNEPFLGPIMDFIWKSVIITSVVGLRRSSKALPKDKLAPKKDYGNSSVICCPPDPLQLSESQQNYYVWEVCSAALVNRKGPILFHDQQLPTIHCTASASNLNNWAKKFCLITVFTWPLANWLPLLQQLLAEKDFHYQQDAENALQEFI